MRLTRTKKARLIFVYLGIIRCSSFRSFGELSCPSQRSRRSFCQRKARSNLGIPAFGGRLSWAGRYWLAGQKRTGSFYGDAFIAKVL